MRLSWAAIRNFFAAWRRVNRRLRAHQPVIADINVQIGRLRRCDECEHNTSGQCGLCDCLIRAKVMLRTERCPDNPPRWVL